jgi:hypothetical protein
MVGRFAGCCASVVSGHPAGRLLSCGISAGLMPASGHFATGSSQQQVRPCPLWPESGSNLRALEAPQRRAVVGCCTGQGVIQAPKLEPRIMRYALTDYEWAAIKPMLPNKPRRVPRVNDRRVLNGISFLTTAPWVCAFALQRHTFDVAQVDSESPKSNITPHTRHFRSRTATFEKLAGPIVARRVTQSVKPWFQSPRTKMKAEKT